MINNLTPKSTQSLYKGAENSRQKQVDAYAKDRHHNQSQMDSLRHSQYRKQADAVKSQKSHMSNNAAKSSRMVTGTSAFNKEGKTFEKFTEFMINEGGRPANPEDAEYLKKNPKPNFSGEKKEEEKEKGGPLVLRDKPKKKEKDEVIDVDVKDVTDKPKAKKPKALPGDKPASELDKAKTDSVKKKTLLDREKFEYAKTQAEKRNKEKLKKEKEARSKARRDKFGNILRKVGGAVGRTIKTNRTSGISGPGEGGEGLNTATMVND